ncbi:MAG: 3,4-dihydroxy-2-butanone-4-phosphate synthase [Rhodospirillaceae bacterium]|nr:3,4-dihydroxy-2-butanone-4-phosphate synthase [Rhodospirillaceae bacterium]
MEDVDSLHSALSSIDEIIDEAREGRMFVLIDDEDRENEGDLIVPAQMATPGAINFMAKHGRGLICLALTRQRVEELGLPLMPQQNQSRHETAFTVSIEAREGVTTGISAADCAHTVQVAIDPSKGRSDVATPGHIFPLLARDGGVLVRAGHTEAAVDVARLAGLAPAGVICEIMNEDGTMARLPDLVAFCQRHGLKMATIADLIAYRRRHDTIVKRGPETWIDSRYGGRFRLVVYENTAEHAEHLALVMGDVTTPEPVLVRVHAQNVLGDVLGDRGEATSGALAAAMAAVAAEGRGAIVLIRETRPTWLSEYVRSREGEAEPWTDIREHGIGAQILIDLGIREMILLHSSRRAIVGLDGFGLKVVGHRPLPHEAE